MKTRKAIKSRFKVTGTGKLMRNRQGRRHILTKKSSNRKRRLSKPVPLSDAFHLKYARLIRA